MDKAPYIIGSPEEWRAFAEQHEVFMKTLPQLQSTIDKIISRSGSNQLPIDRVLMTLGWICGHDFQEILILCGNGLGIGGLKLLRGFYERAVVLQYLAACPSDVEKFFDFNKIHFGRLYIHTAREFNLTKTLSAERIEEILKAKEDAEKRFQVPLCDTCGTTRSPMSWFEGGVLSMAQKARKQLGLKEGEGLDGLYGICFFIPTMHTHPTFFSFKEWVEFSDVGMEWNPDAERRAVSHAMPAAHCVLLHVLKTHNDYYKLALDDELEERNKDFKASWSTATIK